MNADDIRNNKNQISCFYCRSVLGNYPAEKYLILCDDRGEVLLLKRTGELVVTPMVYCSSDCLVFESHLRYLERIKTGKFRKQFTINYADNLPKNQMPDRWKEGNPEIISRDRYENYQGSSSS